MPERIEYLSAVLLTSPEPRRLAAFYRDVLGLPLEEERHDPEPAHWGCELGDVHFAIHPAKGEGSGAPHEGASVRAVHVAFFVFDLRALVERLEAEHGVSCLYPITPLGSSSLATAVRDPDGNEVELTEMGPSWVEHLAERRRAGKDVVARARERATAGGA